MTHAGAVAPALQRRPGVRRVSPPDELPADGRQPDPRATRDLRVASWLPIVLLLLACLVAPGCGTPPRADTTFLTSLDLVDMTDRMAQSLARDPRIGARGPDAPPWVVSIYRVVNHTNQVIPEREKWAYVGRLRALLAQSRFSHEHALIWVAPPERWAMISAETGGGDEPPEQRLRPTHQLTAVFSALTQTSAAGRSDTYLCSFQLVSLETGLIVWEDAWEVKRSRSGLTYD